MNVLYNRLCLILTVFLQVRWGDVCLISNMAARRTTNNSVSTLDEQSAIIESVVSKEKDSKTKEKEKKKAAKDKKRVSSSAAGSAHKTQKRSSAVSATVSVPPEQDEFDSVPEFAEEEEEEGEITWAEAKAHAQLTQFPYGQNLGFSQEEWNGWVQPDGHVEGRADHAISEEDYDLDSQVDIDSVSDITGTVKSAQDIPLPIPTVVGTGALADFLREQLNQVKECDKVSPKIADDAALVINKILKESVYVTEMEKLTKSHPRVQNIEYMKVPKLDVEVYEVVQQKVRNLDQGFQSIQKAVMSAVSALAPVLSLLISRGEGDDELNQVGRNLGESIKLMAFVNNTISAKRREIIKPYLAPIYAKVLTKGHETTPDWLYGGDLLTTTKKCEAAKRIGQKILKPTGPVNDIPRGMSNRRARGRGAGVLRGFIPMQTQGIRFPNPQSFNQGYAQQQQQQQQGQWQYPRESGYKARQNFQAQGQGQQRFPRRGNMTYK